MYNIYYLLKLNNTFSTALYYLYVWGWWRNDIWALDAGDCPLTIYYHLKRNITSRLSRNPEAFASCRVPHVFISKFLAVAEELNYTLNVITNCIQQYTNDVNIMTQSITLLVHHMWKLVNLHTNSGVYMYMKSQYNIQGGGA